MRLYGVKHRVPDIIDIPVVFLIEVLFKGKNDKHPAHRCLQLPRTALIPRPHFGADVIKNFDVVFLAETGHLAVKPSVIDQDDHIRLEVDNIPAASAEIPGDLDDVQYHLDKAHNSELRIVNKELHSLLTHVISSQPAKHRIRIMVPNSLYKVTSVKVTGTLACYEIVTHS